MADHKLFNQLSAAEVSEDEIAELYADLTYIFGSPFDAKIEEAVIQRGCTYVEFPNQLSN